MIKLVLILIVIFSSFIGFSQKNDSIYYFYFYTNEFTQSNDSILKFQKFISKFQKCLTCTINLEAHADKIGTASSNKTLAMNRLNFVKNLLPKILKTNEIVYGEQKAQNSKNNANYRIVKLTIKSELKANKNNLTLQAKNEKRIEEFKIKNKAISLKILFSPGKTDLLSESYDDLDLLFDYLEKNKNVKAKLIGHVCCSPEMQLSLNRALTVYNYIVNKGIAKERLSYFGESNTKPLVEEINEYNEKLNRRVEVVFLD